MYNTEWIIVQSAAGDAHDRDYKVFVLANACAAANESDHFQALKIMVKFSYIVR